MISFISRRDIPLRFISLNLIVSVLISRIYGIFVKHYDGLTNYHMINFGGQFFSASCQPKQLQFLDLSDGKG